VHFALKHVKFALRSKKQNSGSLRDHLNGEWLRLGRALGNRCPDYKATPIYSAARLTTNVAWNGRYNQRTM